MGNDGKEISASIKTEAKLSHKEQVALNVIEEHIKDACKVEFAPEYKAFLLIPTGDFSDAVTALINNPKDQNLKSEWEKLIPNLLYASENLTKVVGQGYSLILVNPANKEKQLLSASDGEVLYNFIDEQ